MISSKHNTQEYESAKATHALTHSHMHTYGIQNTMAKLILILQQYS